MSFTEAIKVWAEGVIGSSGYGGLAFLTLLGNANIPVPSEAVMPFAGILAGAGKMNLHVGVWAGVGGSMLGSVVSYGFGAFLGRDFLKKYGKYVLMRTEEVDHADRWFDRYGLPCTLWGRFVPVVRSFVSLPAGMYRSSFRVFLLYSLIGNVAWCYLWAYLGLLLGAHWGELEKQTHWIDMGVLAVLLVLLARWLYRHFSARPDPES